MTTEATDSDRGARARGPSRAVHAVWLAAGLIVLWMVRDVALLAFAGVLFGVFLCGVTDWLDDRLPVKRSVALAITLFALLLVALGFGAVIGKPIVEQVAQLQERLPGAIEKLEGRFLTGPIGKQVKQRVVANVGTIVEKGLLPGATGLFSATLGLATGFVVVCFIGIFLAMRPGPYVRGVLVLSPRRHRDTVARVLDESTGVLRSWLVGKFICACLIGVATGAGLAVLGIPYYLAFGLFAAVAVFVPIVGPVISFIPPLLVALADDPVSAMWVLGLYVIVQGLESYIVTPLVQRKAIELPPAVAIASQAVMTALGGVLGLLVAVPTAAFVMTAVKIVDGNSDQDSSDLDAGSREASFAHQREA